MTRDASADRGFEPRKRVLVTGGAGFLGSHLCERLLAEGAEVLCVDDFSTGSASNLERLLPAPGFRLIERDVTRPAAPETGGFGWAREGWSSRSGASGRGGGEREIDEIYNLACPASPPRYQLTPVQTIRTNVVGALQMLDLAEQVGARILQASTSEIYGDPQVHPQTEDYWGHVNPIGRRSCYDEGKRCAETLFFDYHREIGLEIKVARIFNTYGPRMAPDDGRVVSNFIVQALEGRPITVSGAGDQTRSFCYVDDMIEGLVAMMASPAETTGPINLGNPVEFTIRGLAELILEMTESKSEILRVPLPSDDPVRRCPDITLARSALGWAPTTALREGLEKTIAYFESIL